MLQPISKQLKKPTRLLVVDDSSFIRRVIENSFKNSTDIQIVGLAKHGEEAIQQTLELRPDVVTLDVEMPVMDGLTALKHIMLQVPTPVIMFSSLTRDGAQVSFDSLRYGAVDFMPKPSGLQQESIAAQTMQLQSRIRLASQIEVPRIRRIQAPNSLPKIGSADPRKPIIVCCEDCGSKNSIPSTLPPGSKVICGVCRNPMPVIAPKRVAECRKLVYIATERGGYSACLQLIPELLLDTETSVIITLHDDPRFVKPFAKYLNQFCAYEVEFVESSSELLANRVYVLSDPGLKIDRNYLQKVDADEKSAASAISERFGARAVAFLSSGSSSAAVADFRVFVDRGSKLFLQAEASCLYPYFVRKIKSLYGSRLKSTECSVHEFAAHAKANTLF